MRSGASDSTNCLHNVGVISATTVADALTRGSIMSFIDKAKNAAEDAIGKAKEVVGDVTDNKDLEAEGKKDQGSAGIKKVGENIKDTFK